MNLILTMLFVLPLSVLFAVFLEKIMFQGNPERIKTKKIFISVGDSCNVKKQIDINVLPDATLFFDWLLTDMSSVNKVIDCEDISTILNYQNISDLNDNTIKIPGKSSVKINSLWKCISIHDIPEKYSPSDIYDFIEKYKRRWVRIMDYIKSQKELIFVRYGVVTKEEKDEFIRIVKKTNPLCKFKLVELFNQNERNSRGVDTENFLSIRLNNYRIGDIDIDDWTTSYFDWKRIFSHILKPPSI